MSQITGGEAVVESLIANGMKTVFGLPGAQLDPIFAALHDRTDRIRHNSQKQTDTAHGDARILQPPTHTEPHGGH